MIKNCLKKNTCLWQWFIFCIPKILIAYFLFCKINRLEDSITENYVISTLPFICYCLSLCLAGWLIIIFIKHQSKTGVFICMMWIGCLLVFMGKTFDLYPYPDNLSAYIYIEADNTKTAAGVLDKIHFMIMVFISFYCTFSAFFDHHAGIDRKNCLHTLLRPSWYLSSFFLFSFLLLMLGFIHPVISNDISLHMIQLLFSLGIFFYTAIALFQCQRCQHNIIEIPVTTVLYQFARPLTATGLICCFIAVFMMKPFEIDIDYFRAYNDLGIAYLNHNKYEKAEHAFNKALKVKPDCYYAYFGLAFVYEGQNKLDQAITSLKKSISIFPGYLEARNKLGFVYTKKGMISQAIQAFEKVLEIDPDEINAIKNIAVAKKLLKQKKF